MMALALLATALALAFSATAGLGGSLILVPVLSMLLGIKQGIALAALLLACNNVAKLVVYRRTIPVRAAVAVVLLTMVGSWLGANLMLRVPERWLLVVVTISIASAFLLERRDWPGVRRAAAPVLAFFAGATSGLSGTSGPLKGIALRSLGLDRLHMVGAASLVSLAGDAVKAAVFTNTGLLDERSWTIFGGGLLIMPLATLAGRRFNQLMSERAYAGIFWAMMAGYALRLFTR